MKNRLDGIPQGNPRKALVIALLLGIASADQVLDSTAPEFEQVEPFYDANDQMLGDPEEMGNFYEERQDEDSNASYAKGVNYGQLRTSPSYYEQSRYSAPSGGENILSKKFGQVCDIFQDAWQNTFGTQEGLEDEEEIYDDQDEVPEEDDMEYEEIVDGDEADDEDNEDGEIEELNPDDYELVDEFNSQEHRRLKRVRARTRRTRSSYTKTTQTKVYYKPPVVKKVYVPPQYKKVVKYVPPAPKPKPAPPPPKKVVVTKKPANVYTPPKKVVVVKKPVYVAPQPVYRAPVVAYVPPSYYVRPQTNVYAPQVYYQQPRKKVVVVRNTASNVYGASNVYAAPRRTVVVVKKPVTEKCTPAVYNPTYNTYTPGGSYSYQYGRYIAGYCSPASKRVTAVRSGYYKKTVIRKRVLGLPNGRLCSGKSECRSYCCRRDAFKYKTSKKTRYNTKYRKRTTTTVKIRDNRTYCRPNSYCVGGGGGGGVVAGLIICCLIVVILVVVWKKKSGEAEDEGHVVEEEVLVKEGYEKEVVVEPGQQIVEQVVVEHREDVVEEVEADVEVPEDWVEGQPIPPQKGQPGYPEGGYDGKTWAHFPHFMQQMQMGQPLGPPMGQPMMMGTPGQPMQPGMPMQGYPQQPGMMMQPGMGMPQQQYMQPPQ